MKRRSGTKPSPKLPEPTFFTDRDLGKVVPNILRENGLLVERYGDHFFEKNVTDQEWLAYAARKGWVALSHDQNIKRDPVAVRTVMEENGRLFIVRGQLTGPGAADLILGALRSIRFILARHQEAFIAIVRRASTQGGLLRPEAEVYLTLSHWKSGRIMLPDESEEPAS